VADRVAKISLMASTGFDHQKRLSAEEIQATKSRALKVNSTQNADKFPKS
jgi:hypothetical protein